MFNRMDNRSVPSFPAFELSFPEMLISHLQIDFIALTSTADYKRFEKASAELQRVCVVNTFVLLFLRLVI